MLNVQRFFILILVITLLIVHGCSFQKSEIGKERALPQAQLGKSGKSDKYTSTLEQSKSFDTHDESGLIAISSSNIEASDIKRMIIYTVNISMNVRDLAKGIKDLDVMVAESKGYIISENINKSGDYVRTATFTIKVPAGSLTPFIDKISQLGEVVSKSKSGEDVTEEYVDKSARLENMKREEKRYHEMFNTAKTVDDMLKIEKELIRVRGDIEALQGRLNFLEKNVAMSTVQLTMEERAKGTPKSFWNFGETFENAKTALKHLIKSLICCSIYFVIVFIPLAILIAIPIFILIKFVQGAKRQDKTAGDMKKTEKSQ